MDTQSPPSLQEIFEKGNEQVEIARSVFREPFKDLPTVGQLADERATKEMREAANNQLQELTALIREATVTVMLHKTAAQECIDMKQEIIGITAKIEKILAHPDAPPHVNLAEYRDNMQVKIYKLDTRLASATQTLTEISGTEEIKRQEKDEALVKIRAILHHLREQLTLPEPVDAKDVVRSPSPRRIMIHKRRREEFIEYDAMRSDEIQIPWLTAARKPDPIPESLIQVRLWDDAQINH